MISIHGLYNNAENVSVCQTYMTPKFMHYASTFSDLRSFLRVAVLLQFHGRTLGSSDQITKLLSIWFPYQNNRHWSLVKNSASKRPNLTRLCKNTTNTQINNQHFTLLSLVCTSITMQMHANISSTQVGIVCVQI